MSDDAKPSQLLYDHLADDEQAKLEVHEDEIATLLITMLGVRGGARWLADESDGHRHIRLDVADRTPATIFEITAMDLAEMSSADLMSEISHTIRQI